jgi:selenocysteine lyase/cysteine desulfurase
VLAAEDAGATVRWVDIREEDATLDLASFEAALSERTRVVAFTLASNAVGTITPAAELSRLVHERTPAIVACDGVHLAQHRRIDVRAIGADLVACSPYKIFGPHLGILFGRREVLSWLRPYKVRPADDALPFAFETWTQNHEGFAGWVAAVGPGRPGERGRAARRCVRASDRPVEVGLVNGPRRGPRDRLGPPVWDRGHACASRNAPRRSRSG